MRRGWLIIIVCSVAFTVLGGVAAVAFVRTHIVHYVAAFDDMEPTIVRGQRVFVGYWNGANVAIERGDVLAFFPPVYADDTFFERVVALPDDRVAIRGGRLIIGARRVEEPYVREPARYQLTLHDYGMYVDGRRLNDRTAVIPPRTRWKAADTVPHGCYVVLGDNRNRSSDSHVWGFLCPNLMSPVTRSRPRVIGPVIQLLLGR